MGAIDRILDQHDRARTIRIPTFEVGTTDFDLTDRQQRKLLKGGYIAAQNKLKRFDWHKYLVRYRGARARVASGDTFESLDRVETTRLGPPSEGPVRVIDGVEYRE